MRAAINKQEK